MAFPRKVADKPLHAGSNRIRPDNDKKEVFPSESTMLRDDDAFPMAERTITIPADEPAEDARQEQNFVNDDLDDVFGSAPPSPLHEPNDDSLREIASGRGNTEPSDIPRLKEKHETEGFRDGVSKGKGQTVQEGFDEGYGLGAVLGLTIGKILGILEGIHNALIDHEERQRVGVLYSDARKELSTEGVFGHQWWGEDGIWKFEVPGEGEGKIVVFPDVVAAHPLVIKWEQSINEEIKRWGLDLNLMEGDNLQMEEVKGAGERATSTEPATVRGAHKKELSW